MNILVADMAKIRNRSLSQRKKDQKEKEENIDAKISQEIEKLDKDIMRSTELLRSSMDFLLPECKYVYLLSKHNTNINKLNTY